MEATQADIEARLQACEPAVEVLVLEQVAPDKLRLVIDHPQGVDLDLCERVTNHLRELLVDYGLEVSSPGPERPLTKPSHFQNFLGSRARVRTTRPFNGQKTFTGELVAADEDEVTVAAQAGVISIPYSDIRRSNLLEG